MSFVIRGRRVITVAVCLRDRVQILVMRLVSNDFAVNNLRPCILLAKQRFGYILENIHKLHKKAY